MERDTPEPLDGFEDLGLTDPGPATPICVWTLSLDGRVQQMNAEAEAFSGLSDEDARSRPWSAFWPEESRFSVERAISMAAAGRVAKFRTFDALGPLGGEARAYWETLVSPVLGADRRPVALTAISSDVTTEVETSAFLGAVIQSLPSPLTVRAIETNRYVLWNRAAEAVFGVEASQAVGRTAEELFGPDMLAALSRIGSFVEFGETKLIEGVRLPERRGGGVYDVKVLGTFDDLGARHVICMGEDVTQHHQQAKALHEALGDAERASLAKSTFLANMSHELRTPMNGIVAGADLLARESLSDSARELVGIVRNSGLLLERLLADILDLAQIEAGRVTIDEQVFHLGDLLRSIEGSCRLGIKAEAVDFSMSVSSDLDVAVQGDPLRLRQVLVNLITNATKFTDSGLISLTAFHDQDGGARFCVTDTGIGFDEAEKARIFERFQQADASITRRFGGSGLGLAISRELVGLMGGQLDCESAPSHGSRFWFSLPLHAVAASELPVVEDQALEAGHAVRVLIADDHPTNRRIVELMLADSADVICVENGREAVQAYLDTPVDVVLMDVQMPVMDGLTAVREIRRLETEKGLGRLPIVMLTANAGDEHERASRSAGADLHLQKPITATALFTALNTVLGNP